MIDRDPRDASPEGAYPPPSFEELVEMGQLVGLVSGYETDGVTVQLRAVGSVFHLSLRECELLLHGILLGYFFGQDGGDLMQAAPYG